MSTAWDISPSPLLLGARCLGAFAFDETYTSLPDDLHLACKASVLPELNIRAQSPREAIDDTTIHALLDLVAFELTMTGADAQNHLEGLKTIICLRGGAYMLHGNLLILYNIVELVELIDAIIMHRMPLLQNNVVDCLLYSQKYADSRSSPSQYAPFKELFRLVSAELDDMRIHVSGRISLESGSFTDLLEGINEYTDVLKRRSTTESEIPTEIRPKLLRAISKFREATYMNLAVVEPLQQCAQACYYAAAVLYNLSHQPPGAKDNTSAIDLTGLSEGFLSMEESTMMTLRYLSIWT